MINCLGLPNTIFYSQTNRRPHQHNHKVSVNYVISLILVTNAYGWQSSSTNNQSPIQGIYDHICLTQMVGNVNIIVYKEL